MTTKSPTKTNATSAARDAAKLAKAIADTKENALASAIAKRFAPLAGGEWAEYSAQVRYAESVLIQILVSWFTCRHSRLVWTSSY